MAKDRTRYFRVEARELLERLSGDVLELERSPGDTAIMARLLRHAHTLKGAARVVGETDIGELAHAVEDALETHREPGAPAVPRQRIDACLRTLDAIAAAVAALDPSAATAPAGAAPGTQAPVEHFQSVRVDLREMDALLESVLEAGVQATALRRQLGRLDHARELAGALADHLAARRAETGTDAAGAATRLRPLVDELRRSLGEAQRALAVHADHTSGEIAQLRSSADRLRLLPARAIFGALERAVRDAARSAGVQVAFEAAGGELRVDGHVLAALRDALLHVVRNAVAHGIEPPAARVQAGKEPVGRVRLEVERRGRRLALVCRDDGRGIDVEAVRAAAVERGLLAPDASLDPAALGALLLLGKLSTRATVTELAGRGVGLDVVRDTAARLGADVAIRSEPAGGTTVELSVPLSLAAITALHLQAEGAEAAIPLDAVRVSLFVEPSRITSAAGGAALAVEGELLRFVPLARVLGRSPAAAERRRFWSVVVVRAGGRQVAIGADRLLGTSDLLVRPLPAFAEASEAVAGASLDAEGNPLLVLDPAGLVAVAQAMAAPEYEGAPAARAPILVVDDSLTTRMLEQSILESAGYEVELAVSAEEALGKAAARRFGLFVVDVEMPGMDGYEFVRVTRADPRFAGTPAILVTSRGAPEDRKRGVDAGASAYIVKGEFDQGRLLATIEELLQ